MKTRAICTGATRRISALLVAIMLMIIASGCGSPRRGEPVAGIVRPKTAAVLQGEKVFSEHCHTCHPGGEGGLGPSLNDKPLPGFLMKLQVRQGLGVMPAFGKDHISSEELDHLVDYIVALRNLSHRESE